jgi:tRNA threonylcarbamoyladenosine biosynthesis protein TsaE
MPDTVKLVDLGLLQIDDLPGAAAQLLKQSEGLHVWLLKGEMGSGKTTLVKHIVNQLGVKETVSSPTFSLVNQYGHEGGKVVYHFDLYRLKNEMEAFDIGLDEYLTSGNLCLIEWPEKLVKLLPEQYFEVQIQPYDSWRRKIYYGRHD